MHPVPYYGVKAVAPRLGSDDHEQTVRRQGPPGSRKSGTEVSDQLPDGIGRSRVVTSIERGALPESTSFQFPDNPYLFEEL